MLTPSRTHLTRALLRLCLATAIVTVSPRSFAQNGEVKTLIDTGLERYKRQDYEGARAIFARAHEVEPSEVGILFNLALAELHAGHPLDAANHLRTFIASPQSLPDRRESARTKWLPDAEAQLGRVSIDVPSGTHVFVDGAEVGMAPFELPVYVAPGDHDLRAQLGSGERSVHITSMAGGVVTARFAPEPPPPSRPASVLPPAPPTPLAAHEAPPPSRATPSTAKIATVAAMGGVAVAAAAMAVGFGVAAKNDQDHAADLRAQMGNNSSSCSPPGSPSLPAQCPQLQAATDDQHSKFWLQIGFYVGAGTLAVAGAATWLLWPNASAQSGWTVRPSFDGCAATAVLAGSF
ncbi:MAG TPA: hypothetical protein VKQ71_15185 [Acidimicrobiales bacterium]|nr:hypothetical protein [Acidimicrobiales bacterium]